MSSSTSSDSTAHPDNAGPTTDSAQNGPNGYMQVGKSSFMCLSVWTSSAFLPSSILNVWSLSFRDASFTWPNKFVCLVSCWAVSSCLQNQLSKVVHGNWTHHSQHNGSCGWGRSTKCENDKLGRWWGIWRWWNPILHTAQVYCSIFFFFQRLLQRNGQNSLSKHIKLFNLETGHTTLYMPLCYVSAMSFQRV